MTHRFASALAMTTPAQRKGVVRAVAPGRIEASGPHAAIGDLCRVGATALAQVAATAADHIVLVPLDQTHNVRPDDDVTALPQQSAAPVGDIFAGRAIDAMAKPIDGGPALHPFQWSRLDGSVLAPLERVETDAPLVTGVRAIDGLLTLGRGQRVGVFSASGVGKTTLITQLATQVQSDRCVICLVGERGREVEAIWRAIGARADRQRFTCVAATSDLSAPLRARALDQALALAEHWRANGDDVLLIVDSITRYAMALREIGLAAGAPPTLRAYTPNVFAALPRIVERCGAARAGGSITALMTVLSETDDVDDPIVEVMKALLDGHVVLSRALAEQGHFPAIDILRSVSRQSEKRMRPAHNAAAQRVLALASTYEEARMIVENGLYKGGANAKLDEAIKRRDALLAFLRQGAEERAPLADTVAWLEGMSEQGPARA